jgi:hypothetical protein
MMTFDSDLVAFFVYPVFVVLIAVALHFLAGLVDSIREIFNG